MAITYPLNLLDDLPGWSTDFNLLYRQEQSRHASGRTRVKDFGKPIWTATYATKNLSPNTLDTWRAKLNSLENGLQTFRGYPKSRCWPIQHPNGLLVQPVNWVLQGGVWVDSGVWLNAIPWGSNSLTAAAVNSINVNNKALSLKDAPNIRLRAGDYISINENLYQVVEDADADSSGVTPEFEVRPQLNLATTVVDNEVLFNQPYCLMTIVPGSVSAGSGLNGRGSISFQAIEARG